MVNQASSNYHDYSQKVKLDLPHEHSQSAESVKNTESLKLAMGVLANLRNELLKVDIPWDRSKSVSKDYASDKADKIDAFVSKLMHAAGATDAKLNEGFQSLNAHMMAAIESGDVRKIEQAMQTFGVPLTAVLPDGKTTLLEWAIKNENISNEALEGLLIAGLGAHPEDKEVILQIINEHQK